METQPTVIKTPGNNNGSSQNTPPTPESPPPEELRPSRTASRRSTLAANSTYDKIGLTVALFVALAFAAIMWLAGAFFTLTALGINLGAGWALAWWLLPLLITGIEIWLMPRAGMGGRLITMFGIVLALDVASSWYGVIKWLGGRFITLGPGFTVPEGGPVLHILAVIAGLVLAFYPEKLARKAWAELMKVW